MLQISNKVQQQNMVEWLTAMLLAIRPSPMKKRGNGLKLRLSFIKTCNNVDRFAFYVGIALPGICIKLIESLLFGGW